MVRNFHLNVILAQDFSVSRILPFFKGTVAMFYMVKKPAPWECNNLSSMALKCNEMEIIGTTNFTCILCKFSQIWVNASRLMKSGNSMLNIKMWWKSFLLHSLFSFEFIQTWLLLVQGGDNGSYSELKKETLSEIKNRETKWETKQYAWGWMAIMRGAYRANLRAMLYAFPGDARMILSHLTHWAITQ